MGLEIGEVRPEDADIILGFIRALAEYERLDKKVEIRASDLMRDLFGPAPRVYCDLARKNGEPAGFALWFYTYSTFRGRHGIWLEDLFVEDRFRGTGIGRAMMARLAGRCAAEGLGQLEWSVLNWNEPAIDFYRSLGAAAEKTELTAFRLEGEPLAALGGGS